MAAVLCLILLGLFQEVASAGENLALGKSVTQSSSYRNYNGARAVDGNSNGMWKGQSCFATNSGDKKPWWMVDLGSVVKLDTVTIFNRADCCGKRLRNLQIMVYTENPDVIPSATGVVCGKVKKPVPTGESVNVQCNDQPEGRYVRITKRKKNRNDLLSFCEVEITAAPAPVPTSAPAGAPVNTSPVESHNTEVPQKETGFACPSGFTLIGTECLRFVPSYATFVEALTYCETMNSSLLMLKTEQLDKDVSQYIQANDFAGNKYYVGASDIEEAGKFRWIDGSVVDAYWRRTDQSDKPLPRDGKTEVVCGYLNGKTTAWEFLPCSRPLFFICQRHL